MSALNQVEANRTLGLKIFGAALLASFVFSVLTNFTLSEAPEGGTKSGTKTAIVAILVGALPLAAFFAEPYLTPKSPKAGPQAPAEASSEARALELLRGVDQKLGELRTAQDPDAAGLQTDWNVAQSELGDMSVLPGSTIATRREELQAKIYSREFMAWLDASNVWREHRELVDELDQRSEVVAVNITYGDLVVGTTDEYNAVAGLSKSCVLRIAREDLKLVSNNWRSMRINVVDRGEKMYQYTNEFGAVMRTEYRTVYEYTTLQPLEAGDREAALKGLLAALLAMRKARDRFYAVHD